MEVQPTPPPAVQPPPTIWQMPQNGVNYLHTLLLMMAMMAMGTLQTLANKYVQGSPTITIPPPPAMFVTQTPEGKVQIQVIGEVQNVSALGGLRK